MRSFPQVIFFVVFIVISSGLPIEKAYSSDSEYINISNTLPGNSCQVQTVEMEGTKLSKVIWDGNCQDGYAAGNGTITRTYKNGAIITETGILQQREFTGHWTRSYSHNGKILFRNDYYSRKDKQPSYPQCEDRITSQQEICKFQEDGKQGFILADLKNLGDDKIIAFYCDPAGCHKTDGTLNYASASPVMDIFNRQHHTWGISDNILAANNQLAGKLKFIKTSQEQKEIRLASQKLFNSYLLKEEILNLSLVESSLDSKKSISSSSKTTFSHDSVFISEDSEVPVHIKAKISINSAIFKPLADEYEANVFLILFAKYKAKTVFSSKTQYDALSALRHITLKKQNDYTVVVDFDMGDLDLSSSVNLATFHMGDVTLQSNDDIFYFIF